MALSPTLSVRPRRVPPYWLFPMVLLCFASGLLGPTFVEQGHGDIMARCVLYFGVLGAMARLTGS